MNARVLSLLLCILLLGDIRTLRTLLLCNTLPFS